MATKITDVGKIPYNSPGIYFRTIDLTTVTEQTGEFRGAQIGLMEKGPAFEIINSDTYTQRAFRLGELNPDFPTSYYAKQYLEQAEGFKEVRVLGLEGYKDTISYAIAAGYGEVLTNERIVDKIDKNGLMAVLKQRKSSFTGLPAITSVVLEEATQDDNVTMDRTDFAFKLVISFDPLSGRDPMEIVCSLRESSRDYIVKKLGTNPMAQNKIGNEIAPLWVDFIVPSTTEMPYDYSKGTFKNKNYYSPVTAVNNQVGYIPLIKGNIEVSTYAPVDTPKEITQITLTPNQDVVITVSGNYTTQLNTNPSIFIQGVHSVGNNYLTAINGTYLADTITYTGSVTTFKIKSIETGEYVKSNDFAQGTIFAVNDTVEVNDGTTAVSHNLFDVEIFPASTVYYIEGDLTGTLTPSDFSGPIVLGDTVKAENLLGDGLEDLEGEEFYFSGADLVNRNGTTCTKITLQSATGTNIVVTNTEAAYIQNNPNMFCFKMPTWETEMMDFEGQRFLTPVTPWVVGELDNNGDYKRLFRFWSISDGKNANKEIKVDITDINPTANSGKGSFNIAIRTFTSQEDGTNVRLEPFTNVNMDPTSDNYILRRIGDGENFPLRSQFVFIEMNVDEQIEDNELPYGCLGYPNITNYRIQDIPWTVDYDKSVPVARQTLGIANNTVNMRKQIPVDLLSYKSSKNIAGRGFHLNPYSRDTQIRLNLDPSGNFVSNDLTSAKIDEINNTFVFASNNIYLDIKGKTVTQQERVRRNKFTICFYGGFDGWNVYSERTWDDPNSKDYEALQIAVTQFADSELIDTDFTVMVTPDLNIVDHSNACTLVNEMITLRDDAVYLPDLFYDVEADAQSAADLVLSSNFRSSGVAIYHPWVQIEDKLNKVNKWLPPSIIALGTIANLGNQGTVWNPPAGEIKTVVNNLVRARRRLNLADREQLFKANINPISKFGSGNYEIVGVRTTQPYLSALTFLHNKLLICYAKKALRQTLRALLFTMNNQEATDQFILRVTPIFERIKKLNGLSEFKVSTRNELAQNDKTTLYGVIEIVPLYPVERIIVDFVLQDGELNFEQ